MPASAEDRLLYIDIMRVTAIAAVVLQHVAAPVFHESQYKSVAWWIGNITFSAFRWSVPVFLMISGSLLIDAARDISLSVRMTRILIPTAFWSVLYLAIDYFNGTLTLNLALWRIAYGQVHYHLWYLYMLVGLYALLSPLRKLCLASDRKELLRTTVILLVLQCIFFFDSARLALGTGTTGSPLFVFQFIPYLPYVILGYYLRRHGVLQSNIHLLIPQLFLIAGISATYWVLSQYTDSFIASAISHSNFSPLVLASSALVYMTIMKAKTSAMGPSKQITHIFHVIAPLTLGIYVTHPLILRLMRSSLDWSGSSFRYGLGIFPVALLAFVLSLLLSLLISRIPYLKRCVS